MLNIPPQPSAADMNATALALFLLMQAALPELVREARFWAPACHSFPFFILLLSSERCALDYLCGVCDGFHAFSCCSRTSGPTRTDVYVDIRSVNELRP